MSRSVFHICCNLVATRLYHNLFESLDELDCTQLVWVPHKVSVTPEIPVPTERLSYSFTGYQTILDRVFFRRKIRKGVSRFSGFEPFAQDTVCHAHTLYSDGALAFELKRRLGVPYIVTVRNTDINVFWRFFPHLREYAKKILSNASSVIFISPAYRDRCRDLLPPEFWGSLVEKVQVIPNGLDRYWLENPPSSHSATVAERIRVLFVGAFTKNKNVGSLVAACSRIRSSGIAVELRLVGARTDRDGSYANDWIQVLPFSKNKDELASHYRWADVFAMPSFTETFGLVYAEALSQGTPVLFTKGQGFDGWVNDASCAYGSRPTDVEEIARGIKHLHLHSQWRECVAQAGRFDWKEIAERYMNIYAIAQGIGNERSDVFFETSMAMPSPGAGTL